MDAKPIISLKDVTISHENGPLLTLVNLQVHAGEFVYLIGKSGAGKTSLLRTLYADFPIDAGEAEVCGFNVAHLRNRDVPLLRRKIGIVFQNFRLLPDRDVAGNLAFVLRAIGWKDKKQIEARVRETLEAVGIADKAHAPVQRLSEGEQQRVGIARAIINNPEVIVADEPTGNLDPITSAEIMSLLMEINHNSHTTMLISTHDFMMIDKFPARVICCENGTIVCPQ